MLLTLLSLYLGKEMRGITSGNRLVDMFTNSANLKSIRVIRVLQPLRNISQFKKLKNLANTLIRSLPNFFNVGFFLLMIFLMFGIFGVQNYTQSFYNRCRLTQQPVYNGTTATWDLDPIQIGILCSIDGGGLYQCIAGTYCGNPYDYGLDKTLDDMNQQGFIDNGVLTFDNIGLAFLTVFQILTNDNWANTMYNLMNAENPIMAACFCCLIVVLGSFFLINIVLAVILDSFISVQQDDIKNSFVIEHLTDQTKLNEMDMKISCRID